MPPGVVPPPLSSLQALQQLADQPVGDISTGVVPAVKAPPTNPNEASSPIADPDQSSGSLIRPPRIQQRLGGY